MSRSKKSTEPVSVAIYLRVSSEEQAKEGFSLRTQEVLCREELDRRLGEDLYMATVYCDDGFKGTWGLYEAETQRKKFRPDLTRMHEAFKQGLHQIICVWELSRIYRRAGLAEFLDDYFRPHGLEEVISCREPVDMRTASGRFQMNVMAAAGALEVERLGERVRDAHRQRRLEGYMHRRPYGWRPQTDEEMGDQNRRGSAPHEEEREVVRWMAEEYLADGSLRSITQQLNDRDIPTPMGGRRWTRTSLKCVLGNPAHAGLIERDGELIEGQHYLHRFYDPEVFHQIRARLDRNARIPPQLVGLPQYLLAGVLRCGHCGAQMSCNMANHARRRYYRCYSGTDRDREVGCTANSRPADLVEAAIVCQLRSLAEDAEVRDMATSLLPDIVSEEDRRLQGDVARLERKLEKCLDEYHFWSRERYEGSISIEEWDIQREHLMEQKSKLEEQLGSSRAGLRSSEQRATELEQALTTLGDFDATFDGMTLDQQREMVQLLVSEARMLHQQDGKTWLSFTVRALGDFDRVLPRLTGDDTKMTPRQMEAYMLRAQGLHRDTIARKMGISPQAVSQTLSVGKSRVGAKSRDEAWELVRDEIEANADLIALNRPRRRRTADPDRPPLTDTQKQVLSLHAGGLAGPEIAERLDIEPSTVYVHLKNCRDRLGRATNEEAAKHAREMGYID